MGATNPNAGGAPGGGGKGGMGMNRGPGGNAQNNPGGYGSPFNPFDRSSEMNVFPGLTTGQQLQSLPLNWGGRPPISNDTGYGGFGVDRKVPSYGGLKPQWYPDSGVNMGGGTPIGNFTPPTPQPQEPIGGYIGGQPAQFHHQAQGLNKPQPQRTAAGFPAGGLLARLYGG